MTINTRNSINETQKNFVERKNLDTKEYILWDPTDIKF